MDLTPADAGMLVTAINLGAVLAYGLVRMADHWGRRRVLTITIASYMLLSLRTAFSLGA